MADREDNLQWTNEHLNKSMGADEIPDYIEKHPELPEDTKKRMMDAYNQAKAEYEEEIERNYYFNFSNPNCRQFYKDMALSAGKRGVEMGLRQALGFIITDLWFSVKDEIKRSDGTAHGCIEAIICGLESGLSNALENYKQLFNVFGEGFLSGVLSSVTTTLCNIFFTTEKNFVRIIRQAWGSITEAVSILFFDKDEKYFCDRMTSAAKILASGASVIIGTGVQETVTVKLSKITISENIKDILAVFAGSLCTGLLTVTLLFYIDNDPFNKFIEYVCGHNIRTLKAQALMFEKYCADMQNIDIEQLRYEADCVNALLTELDGSDDITLINKALNETRACLGIKSLWEGSSLDEKMNDKDWVLSF